MITITQDQYLLLMKAWQKEQATTTISTLRPPYDEIRGWRKEGRLVVPPNLALKRKIMFHIHDTAGPKHPGLSKTLRQTAQLYWWPDMKSWVTRYMENCERCHHNLMAAKTTSLTTTSLHSKIREAQRQHHATLAGWSSSHLIEEKTDEERNDWMKEGHLMIPLDEALRREILQLLHDTPTAGHPGRDETFPSLPLLLVARDALVGYGLRCGVRHMPAEQKHHSSHTHPTVPHPHPRKRTPIPTDRPRSHHWTAAQWTP